ncbi:MAG: glycosyltransferase family 4 protein [Bacteroidota bacterium]
MKRAALFIPGGVGDPASGMYIPALTGLVRELSLLHDLTVYTLTRPDGKPGPESCGRARIRVLRSRHDSPFPLRAGEFLRAFRADHAASPYDLVHGFWGGATGLAAVLAGKMGRIPSVVSFQGGEPASLPDIGYGDMRSYPLRRLTAFIHARADVVTFLTLYQKEMMEARSVRKGPARVIPLGVGGEFFREGPLREPRPPYHLLHVGTITPVKDPGMLLGVYGRMSRSVPCTLTMAGEDRMDGWVRSQAAELGLDVRLTGHLPQDALRREYAGADLLLVTSHHEGQSVAAAEAAAMGVPVCGTRVGLVADLSPSCMAAVTPQDDGALASRALDILHDPREHGRLRENAQRWARLHTTVHTASAFAALYDSPA